MAKMKNNQDGGGANASDPKAAGKSIEKIESKEGAAKYKGGADGHMEGKQKEGAARYKGAHDYDTSKGSHGHDSQGGHGAARMGYAQSFGAARMNGYAKGAARVASIMSFGASKYMNHGAADNHIDPVDGDAVPNYDTTNTVNRPNTTPTSSTSGTKTKTVYTPPTRTAEGDAAYAALTPEQRKAQDDKYRRLNTKTVKVSASSENAPTSSSSSTTTTNTKIGNLTPNSVTLSGDEQLQNNKNKIKAEREARVLARKQDSINAANQYLERQGRRTGELTKLDAVKAQRAGDRAALSAGLRANRDMGYPRSRGSIYDIIKEISARPNIDMD